MPRFGTIISILSLISLVNTILEDDILYDIKWQPELKPVGIDRRLTAGANSPFPL